ncbi:DUF4224 domain-containing protein [Salmonella enterica]
MSDRFLTEEELEDATGASQKSLQKEVLTLNGIYFIRTPGRFNQNNLVSYKSPSFAPSSTSRVSACTRHEF